MNRPARDAMGLSTREDSEAEPLMTHVAESGIRAGLRPLAGHRGRVSGTGATAAIVADHLARLGAEPETGDDPEDCQDPAVASLAGPLGVGSLCVRWADALPSTATYDEPSTQAVCGLMHIHGRRYGRPRGLLLDVASVAAGVLGTTALLAGLLGARRFGGSFRASTGVDRAALQLAAHYLAVASADSEVPDMRPGGPPFRSLDGVWFEVESMQAETWARFWSGLGAPADAIRDGWRPFQFRFSLAACPLPEHLQAAASEWTWPQIQGAAERTGVSTCAIVGLAGRRRELSLDPGNPARAPWILRNGPRVRAAPPSGGVGDVRAPLRGLLVLEAGRRIQGPLTAHLLRLLGADVLRIEPPGGDPMRGMPPTCGDHSAVWLALNAGKGATELDIKSSTERSRLLELVAHADVFLHNWAPGKAAELGLDAAALHRVNAGLVYAHTSGWSGGVPDPPLGTDFMVQARSGVADALRPQGEPPRPTLMTVLDCLGGMLGAEAVLAGLLHREVAGRGSTVECSLLSAATMLTGGRPESTGREPWQAKDGWILIESDMGDTEVAGLTVSQALAAVADRGGRAVPVTTALSPAVTGHPLAGVLTLGAHGCLTPPSPWSIQPHHPDLVGSYTAGELP